MTFCLEYQALLDIAKLTDGAVNRAYEIGSGEWSRIGPKRSGEKLVKCAVAFNVGFGRFLHVDAVAIDEPAYDRGRHPAGLGVCEFPCQQRNGLFGQEVLEHDSNPIQHMNPG